MDTLKRQINGPYSSRSTVIGTLAVDGWAATFGTISLLLVVTSHLVLQVFALQLLLSGIIYETHRRHLKSHLFHSTFPTASDPPQRI